MRLIGWNVNGLRSVCKKGFLPWVRDAKPDILCLQETRVEPEILEAELRNIPGYSSYIFPAQKKGYSGVGLYTRPAPKKVDFGLGHKGCDEEGRVIVADYGDFVLLNVYFPNGGMGNKRVAFKLDFYEFFLNKVDELRKFNKNLIITGDVNTAHEEIDLARPKENVKNTGFLPEERAWVSKFLSHGYVDTFRHFCKEPGHYSYWDYKTGARARNVGWRIDYFFVTEEFLPRVKRAFILPDVHGSDHCPVGIDID